MSSRKYIKRIWRVPKHRGPAEYLGMVVVKALVKHGWPAKLVPIPGNFGEGFQIEHVELGMNAAPDFWEQVAVTCRVVAKTHSVEWVEYRGLVVFSSEYVVNEETGRVRKLRGGEVAPPIRAHRREVPPPVLTVKRKGDV